MRKFRSDDIQDWIHFSIKSKMCSSFRRNKKLEETNKTQKKDIFYERYDGDEILEQNKE